MTAFVSQINDNFGLSGTDSLHKSLFEQYEKTIVNSLITAFGLDIFINDRLGGDVDTIHNVRQVGKGEMTYKNVQNREAWQNNPAYSRGVHDSLHRDAMNFNKTKHDAREKFQATGDMIKDDYTGGNVGFFGKSKSVDPGKKAELDHIISTKEIHSDPGRILAELSANELADVKSNFAFTNKSLNASMQDKTKKEYVAQHPELSEETKAKILALDKRARDAYEKKLAATYYTSAKFRKDLLVSAGSVGVKMGIRQVMGLVFSEIWFAVKDELDRFDSIMNTDIGELLHAIGDGVKKGVENCKRNYKALLEKFKDGALAGFLSSITTTLANIFFTTSKNVVRIIRQTWVSIVDAVKILFINPDHLLYGERMLAAVKVVATGASIAVGVLVSEALSKTAIGAFPVVGEIVQTFCGSFVTGIMSCTLLYFLDTNPMVHKAVEALNMFKTGLTSYMERLQDEVAFLESYAAKLMNIDLDKFKEETACMNDMVQKLDVTMNDDSLIDSIKSVFKKMGWKPVYDNYDCFDDYMNDKNAPPLEFC